MEKPIRVVFYGKLFRLLLITMITMTITSFLAIGATNKFANSTNSTNSPLISNSNSPSKLNSSFNSSNVTPIDVYLRAIEKDISSSNTNKSQIDNEVSSLLELKQNSSIFYIPEINYLTGKSIENPPPSLIQKYRNEILILDILITIATIIITMLGVFTLIYTADRYLFSEVGRNLIILTGTILIMVTLILQGYLFYLVFGLIAGLGFKSKEKLPFTIIMILLLIAHLIGVTAEKAYFNYISDSKNMLYAKLKRDNYAPPFLINKEAGIYLKVDYLSNNQALLHPIKESELTTLLKSTSDNKIKAVLYNNLGCIAFNEGNLTKALPLFEKAKKLFPMTKTYYNLFITYSSLLNIQKAKLYSEKLKRADFSFDRTVPIVANISDIYHPKIIFEVPTYKIAAFIIGIIIGVIITTVRKSSSLISINPFFSYLPGYKLYYYNKYNGIVFLIGILTLTEILIRGTLCLMNQ